MGGRAHPVRRNSRPISGLLSMSMQIKESEELRPLPFPSPDSERGMERLGGTLPFSAPGSERSMERSPATRRVALGRTPSTQQLLPLATIESGRNHSFLEPYVSDHNDEDTSSGIMSPINIEGNCER
jgi:hypothetical protein